MTALTPSSGFSSAGCPSTTDAVIAERGGERLTAARVAADIAHNAARIAALGLRSGALYCDDAAAAATGLLALLSAGAEAVVVPTDRPEAVAALGGRCSGLISDRPRPGPLPTLVLEPAPAGLTADWPVLVPDGRVLFYTSGSTGAAKPVERTVAGLAREVATLEQMWGGRIAPTAMVIGTVTHQHVYGLIFRVLWPLATGRRFQSATLVMWDDIVDAVTEGAVVVTSPAHLARLPSAEPPLPARPALVLTAGAPLAAADAAAGASWFRCWPTEVFGSTETGALATRQQRTPEPEHQIWRPLPGIVITSDDDRQLQVRTPFVADGADWIKLADRVALTDDGGFRFEGRADRIVKLEGKRVSLPEVEGALRNQATIADAAVVPVARGVGARLGAVVVPTSAGLALLAERGRSALIGQVRRALLERFEPVAVPRRWRLVPAVPVNSMGKPDVAQMAAMFGDTAPTLPEVAAIRFGAGEHEVTLTLWLQPRLRSFEGHFPGLPVLPGVVQVQWALAFAQQFLGLTQRSVRELQVKFHAVLQPGALVTLCLSARRSPAALRFEYRANGRIHSSGRMQVEEG